MTLVEVEGGYAQVKAALQTIVDGGATAIHSVNEIIKGRWIIIHTTP